MVAGSALLGMVAGSALEVVVNEQLMVLGAPVWALEIHQWDLVVK